MLAVPGSVTAAGASNSAPSTPRSQDRSVAYELWVVQDTRHRPDGCGPNSSTGRHGMATLTFRDGELRVRRIGGEACFAFPFVTGREEWAALGDSGPYRSSRAVLHRAFRLDVRTGSVTGHWLAG